MMANLAASMLRFMVGYELFSKKLPRQALGGGGLDYQMAFPLDGIGVTKFRVTKGDT